MAANDDGMQDQMAAANPVTREQVVSMTEFHAEALRIKGAKESLFPFLVNGLERHAGSCVICAVRAEQGRKLLEAEGAMLRG